MMCLPMTKVSNEINLWSELSVRRGGISDNLITKYFWSTGCLTIVSQVLYTINSVYTSYFWLCIDIHIADVVLFFVTHNEHFLGVALYKSWLSILFRKCSRIFWIVYGISKKLHHHKWKVYMWILPARSASFGKIVWNIFKSIVSTVKENVFFHIGLFDLGSNVYFCQNKSILQLLCRLSVWMLLCLCSLPDLFT